MFGTPMIPALLGRKFKDSMKDYPPSATHNIVLVSKTEPLPGAKTKFIGNVISVYCMENKLESTLQALMEKHGVTRDEIEVIKR